MSKQGCIWGAGGGHSQPTGRPLAWRLPLTPVPIPPGRRSYVSEEEAGRRLAQVVSDPSLNKSGVYWSWSNDKGAFENQVSEEVADDSKGVKLWEISEKLVGLA